MRAAVIDGNADDREKIVKIIQESVRECEIAGMADNGKDGYELIRSEFPDIVIMDMQLPDMNGLKLLKKLRSDKLNVKVLILTEDQDFEHARQAIGLGIDNYLLKPVTKTPLKNAVLQIIEKLVHEKAVSGAVTLENLLWDCINGRIHSDRKIDWLTKNRFGFTLDKKGTVFTLWMGSNYTEYRQEAREILETAVQRSDSPVCILEVEVWRLMVAVICCEDDKNQKYKLFRDKIVPQLCQKIPGELVCLWSQMEHVSDIMDTLTELRKLREWNLSFERGNLISREDIEKLSPVTLKYPGELENRLRQAVLSANGEEIRKCYYRLYDLFQRDTYSPKEIKECLIHFCMSAVDVYKAHYVLDSDLSVHFCLQKISDAMSWGQIREAIEEFLILIRHAAFSSDKDAKLSPLVRRAVQMTRKYYDQGVTLEEIASRLFVSEEYLSSQFKKETGKGFAETVRSFRMERIKDLLINTDLKLNQIAELTGYTDPKYMSRVFKDETGMLPSDFRKKFH